MAVPDVDLRVLGAADHELLPRAAEGAAHHEAALQVPEVTLLHLRWRIRSFHQWGQAQLLGS